MVAGNLKIAFAEAGKDIELAIPTSIVGSSFRTSGMFGAQRFAVPFAMNDAVFLIELKYMDSE